jgi:chloramphenicol-sensitive protein RarD
MKLCNDLVNYLITLNYCSFDIKTYTLPAYLYNFEFNMTLRSETTGWLFGVGAFVFWGLAPIYFKALDQFTAPEILAHRIAWCVPVTLLLMLALGKKIRVRQVVSNRKLLLGLTATTGFISLNWYLFTWAVTHEQILATSLGYFINPIMSILAGVIFLNERLSKLQWAAVLSAALGVLNQIINYGEIPWIALALAISFTFYGFIRKKLDVDSLNGLLVETLIALPFAVAYIVWTLDQQTTMFLQTTWKLDALLISGGIITAIPLIWFAAAAKKIPLNSIGFLQFIAPSLSFILATYFYNEHLGDKQLISFGLIWFGLGLYLVKPIQKLFNK